MDDERVMHGIGLDEAYHVERVLASRRGTVTERVTLDGAGPFIRKKIPLDEVNRAVWAKLAACDCLRLPQISATYELPDTFVVVYAYVPGETLETRIEQRGALEASEAARIVLDLCEAASALHEHGIVHCDIKPSNIVLAADGAHLIDMDIARLMSDTPRKKRSGHKGTVGFAAPEQFFGRADARSDVHAIGCVLGFMLTGLVPDDEAYEEKLADESRVPRALRGVVEQACDFEPSRRFASADALARAVRCCLGTADVEEERAAAGTPQDASDGAAADDRFDTAPPHRWQVKQDDRRAPDDAERRARSRDRRIIKYVLLALAVVTALCATGIIIFEVVTRASAPAAETVQQDADAGADAATDDADDTAAPPGTGDIVEDKIGGDDAAAGGGDAPTAADVDPLDSLELVETWWERGTDGLFHYAYGIKNTSKDLKITFTKVTLTGRDASGGIVSVDSQYMSDIFPGEVQYFGGIAGNDTAPDSVEFTIVRPEVQEAVHTDARQSSFTVDNVAVVPDSIGNDSVVGEVTLEEAGGDMWLDPSTVSLCVVLRDAQGAIVFGQTGYATLPDEGETVTFEVTLDRPPAYESIDVYAMPW